MPLKKKDSQADEGGGVNPLGWMVTFSDLITLLLTFFVLLISMSSMDIKAMQQSFGMFSGASGVLDFSTQGQLSELGRVLDQIDALPPTALADEQALKDMIFQFEDLEFQKLMDMVDQDITVKRDERGLVIQLSDYILFDEGGSVLRMEFLPILSAVANVFRATSQSISVEGHTDSSPLEGGGDAWAWELSLERAIAVVQYFTEEEGILEDRFRVAGFGPSKPLAPNDSPKNRAKNRRIEIIIYKEKLG